MKTLVTGAGGFLGGAIARALIARGDAVRLLARRPVPELQALDAELALGDIRDGESVARACDGVELVFHVAAKVGLWGPASEFEQVNVGGTRRVLEGCRRAGVPKLVFTSSPSVVFDGGDIAGVDESAPYPARFDGHYSRTKALAEEIVLESASRELETVALRPHLVWGPGDRHILPRLLEKARAGRLRRIKGCDKLVDTCYIDDAVRAHLLAAARLGFSPGISGKAYFISQGDPRPLWSVIGGLLGAAGVALEAPELPRWLAYAAAELVEGLWGLAGARSEPPVTRFLLSQLSTAHWFDISAARRDLGYAPALTIEEGLERLSRWLKENASACAA